MRKEIITMLLYFLTIIALSTAAPDRRVNHARATDFQVNQYDSVCENPACVDSASYILKNMDTSVDPCENFYQFSCGQFVKETVIPADEIQVSAFSKTGEKLQEQLLLSMSQKIENNDVPAVKLIKSHYQACMNIDQIEKNSKNELLEILKSLGGCPILEGTSWDETNFDWKKSVYKANKMGYSSDIFISTRVGVDPKNSSRHIVIIDQATTELSRELLLSNTTDAVQVLFDMMMNITKFFGADEEQAKREILYSLQFEMFLAMISLSNEDRRNQTKLNNRIALNQLETSYTFIPWTEYLNEILSPYGKVNSSEEVIVAVPSFLKELSKLLAKTPKRVLANYACMQAVFKSIDNMGQDMLTIEATAREALSGITEQLPRSKICAKSVTNYLVTAVGWLYVSRYFDTDAKTHATSLIQNLRESLHGLIKQAHWMDDKTKYEALEKLESIASHVAYPDEFDNAETVNAYYQSVTPHPESFLQSELEMERFSKMIQYSSLRKPVNAMNWVDYGSAAQVNALYYVRVNSLELPAGILQGHFFNKTRPNYMNYAAIGSIIGHELSHAFDDEGSQYDKNGILTDWWNNSTKQEYLNRAQCIIDQYSNYTLKEASNTPLNGIITQGENIADNIGLKAAYFAYDEWAKKHDKESQLPGLDYTPKQMFWLSYANNWCTKTVPEVLPYILPTNEHALGEFRVIGTVSNMHEFSKDFNCPLKSPMNPVKKCSFW